jgi:hypothetical protein
LRFGGRLNGIAVQGRAGIFNFSCQWSTGELLVDGTCDMVGYPFYQSLGKLFTVFFRFIGYKQQFYPSRSIDGLSDTAGVNHMSSSMAIIRMREGVFHVREERATICVTADKASLRRHAEVHWRFSKIRRLLKPREIHESP